VRPLVAMILKLEAIDDAGRHQYGGGKPRNEIVQPSLAGVVTHGIAPRRGRQQRAVHQHSAAASISSPRIGLHARRTRSVGEAHAVDAEVLRKDPLKTSIFREGSPPPGLRLPRRNCHANPIKWLADGFAGSNPTCPTGQSVSNAYGIGSRSKCHEMRRIPAHAAAAA
jgi:hypothetical protein